MQFKEGTTVYTYDGDKVGDIERFVLDPRGKEIIALVVRKGFLFTEDKVVPVNMVNYAEEDKVVLNSDATDPDGFPTFDQVHYVSPHEVEYRDDYTYDNFTPLYYYPPQVDGMGWYGSVPYPLRVPQETEVTVKQQTIPEGAIVLNDGAEVISSDEEYVGNVERVFTETGSEKITHFSISKGIFFETEKMIPATWVKSTAEDKIRLAVSSKTLERLEEVTTIS